MRSMGEKKEYLYDAFISYRHAELDKFVAEALHREMESFKLPRNLVRKMADNGKTRINRVFRDRDELPIASNLADPITEALDASEFLLVICSPRLPESLWCKKEIETFIKMHDRDHVLAILIEGEPGDSFPEELRFAENKRVNSDGTVTIERIPVEPLAADVRGKSRREVKKKIKEEVIRLAAPMFDCSYDELKQRHRERRMRKILAGAAIGSMICVIFGAVSTTMALKIHGQNIEISEKSQKIEEQSEEIKEQYWTALENYALGEADNALELLEQGDRLEAIRTAKAVLPEKLGEPEKPYTYKAEYALSKSLGVYADGETIIADFMLKHDTNVNMCKVSPDKDRLLVTDDACTIYVWDLLTGELLLENAEYSSNFSITDQEICFLDNDTFFYMSNKKGIFFDIPAGTVTEHDIETGSRMRAYKSGQQIAILGGREVSILDVESMEIVCRYVTEENWQTDSKFVFSDDGKALAFSVSKEADRIWQGTQVLVMDCQSGEITNRYDLRQEEISDMAFDGDTLYVANYENFFTTTDNSYFNEKLEGLIYACDLSTISEFKWIFDDPEKAMYFVKPAGDQDSNILLAASYSGVYLIDRNEGSLVGRIELGECVINVKTVVDADTFFVYTRAGEMFYIRNNKGIVEAVNNNYWFQCNSDNIKQMETGAGGMIITLPYNSANVTVFKTKEGEKLQPVVERDSYILAAAVSPDGNVLVVSDGEDETGIYDAVTGAQTGTMETPQYTSEIVFVGKENAMIAMVMGRNLHLYKNITGEKIAEYELAGYETYFAGEYNEQIACVDSGGVIIYDTASGQEISRTETEETLYGGRFIAVNGQTRHLAAAYPEMGKLVLYVLDDLRKLQSISINAAFVSELFFDQNTDMLYVVYKDNSVEVYENQDDMWDLKIKYNSFDEKVDKAYNLGDGSRVILEGASYGYLLKDNEIIAELPHLKAVRKGSQPEVYVGGRAVLKKIPVYSYEMLLEEAK